MKLRYTGFFVALTILSINFIAALNNSIVQLVLPQLSQKMGLEYEISSVVISLYWLSAGITALPAGKLGDIYSPKQIFIFGMAIFSLSSFLSICVTDSMLQLAVLRAIQGLGASAAIVNGVSLLRLTFPPEEINKMMGWWATSIAMGYMIGPALGGYLVDSLGWKYSFIMNGVITAFFAGYALVTLTHGERNNMSFDLLGSGILSVSIGALLFFLNPISGIILHSLIRYSPLLIFCIGFMLFIKREKSCAYPLVDLNLFSSNRTFVLGLLTGITHSASIQGLNFVLQHYFQNAHGLSPSQSGGYWMLMSLANFITSFYVGKFGNRYEARSLAIYGAIVRIFALLGLTFISFLNSEVTQIYLVVLILIVFGLGMGLTTAPIYSLIIGSLDSSQTGTATGMYNIARDMSSSIGVALSAQILFITSIFFPSKEHIFTQLGMGFLFTCVLIFGGFLFLLRIPRVPPMLTHEAANQS